MIGPITAAIAFAAFIVVCVTVYIDAKAYKVPFGRQYLSPKMQILVLIWLGVALFGNLMFALGNYVR